MKKAKRVLALVLAFAMVMSLAACGSSANNAPAEGSADAAPAANEPVAATAVEGNTSDTPVYGGEVTIYYPKFYDLYDPSMMNEYMYSFWYETLFVIDWSLNDKDTYAFGASATPKEYMAGQLAVDTGVMDYDTATLTVTLRDDVNFQDGEPYNGRALVADDVVWSYSRLIGLNGMEKVASDNPMQNWDNTLYMIDGCEATDEHTVVFHFKDEYNNEVGYTAFLNAKANIGGHEWGELSAEQQADWHYAKGTGPYVLADCVKDNSMKLVRNENYYDYDERYPENKLPYIDTVNLVYIADAANILSQAMAGKLDWFGENGKNVLTTEQLGQLAQENAGFQYTYLDKSPDAIGLKTPQTPFDNRDVREALQHAIDVEGISAAFFGIDECVIPGLWSTANPSWTTVGSWPQELLDQYTYDPELAKQMLADAGYPDGFEFTIELDPTANQEIYMEAARELAQVGVTMNVIAASEMMEAVQHSQDLENPYQFQSFGGCFAALNLAKMMTADNPMMRNSFGHTDMEYMAKLDEMSMAKTVAEQNAIAAELDQAFPAAHWTICLTGVQPTSDWMSKRIGGYNGEKVYYDDNMRTIWSRLWIAE